MAKCESCGNKAGIGRQKCAECESRERAAAQARREQESAEARARYEAQVAAKVSTWSDSFRARINAGGEAFEHTVVYIEVDSVIENEAIGSFDFNAVMAAGLDGWQIHAVIPRTLGWPLFNQHSEGFSTNQTYGAGLGGNVAGVYVVLSRPIRGPIHDAQFARLQATAQGLIDAGYNI